MLKIAIVTNNYKPYSGGVVSSIDSFVSVLNNIGHKVSIITLDFTDSQDDDKYVFRIKCPIKFSYKNNPIAIPWRPKKELHDILKNISPDIIHSQHPFFLGKYALQISKKLNIPIVFTYHTKYDEYLHYIPLPKFISRPIIQNLSIEYCNKINGIIAPSKSIFDYLKSSVNKPLEIIPSGILPVFQKESCNIKQTNKPFKLLTVSRFVKEKNIYFLLDVFSTLNQNDFEFTLIGYGAELENLKNYAYSTLGLSTKNLRFIQRPEKEIISKFYSESDLFIFSSTTETQGLVLAEAMSAGTPVIALEATGSNDIIKNGINGYLVNSKEEMAEKVKLISNNSNIHTSMQKEALKTGQEYNSINTTQKLIEFYNKTIVKY